MLTFLRHWYPFFYFVIILHHKQQAAHIAKENNAKFYVVPSLYRFRLQNHIKIILGFKNP